MSTTASYQRETVVTHPIDIVEEIVNANDWAFERTADDEVVIEISGRWCDYRLYFVWEPDLNALYFSCLLDMRVADKKSAIFELLAVINERLWVGHFDMCSDEGMPVYRYTTLMRGMGGASVEQVEDVIDIALTECERFYPAFQLVLWGGKTPSDALTAAMLEPVGEA